MVGWKISSSHSKVEWGGYKGLFKTTGNNLQEIDEEGSFAQDAISLCAMAACSVLFQSKLSSNDIIILL